MKKLIYVAGPYSKGDIARNIKQAIDVGDKLLELGYIPLVPHLTHFWHIISPKPWDVWLEIDQAILPLCDCVLRLDGESEGADMEVELAQKLNKPVYYSLEQMSEWD